MQTARLLRRPTPVVRGDYVDPSAGRVTFKAFAEQWPAKHVEPSMPSSQI